MWQVVRQGPEPQTTTRERAVAWQVLRAAVVQVPGRAVPRKPRTAHADVRVQVQPVPVETRLAQAPRGGLGVRVVEAVVLLAVVAYFVVGLVGVLLV